MFEYDRIRAAKKKVEMRRPQRRRLDQKILYGMIVGSHADLLQLRMEVGGAERGEIVYMHVITR